MGKIKKHQNLPSNWEEREVLRNKGQFWTPNWVAEAMVAYVARNTNLVFDPATGRGAFFEALLKLNDPNLTFFGTDIDVEVLKDPIYDQGNCFVELRDFIKNPPDRKFRSIVGNPPYIRHHRIDEDTKIFLKEMSAKILGFSIDGRAGYHIYFLLQAINKLENDGRLAFIMPADTCEGKFAKSLWKWISEKVCVEAIITFDEKATPFPNVDTNALVFLLRKSKPVDSFFWVKAKEAYNDDLINFINSEFRDQNFNSLDILQRNLKEGLATGFSRPEQVSNETKYILSDFARVMRGIATGANDFFFLTERRTKELKIPKEFLKKAIGRTRDATSSTLTLTDIKELETKNRPTYLLSIDKDDKLPPELLNYIEVGEAMGLHTRSLIKQRKPWYKAEKRDIPPLLFAYLGRRNVRFIKNQAQVLPLTGFLCVYPIYNDDEYINNLWEALNHPETIENLKLVGKSYGSGAVKVEPGSLNNLPIPEHIVKQYNLKRQFVSPIGQFNIFKEPKSKYKK